MTEWKDARISPPTDHVHMAKIFFSYKWEQQTYYEYATADFSSGSWHWHTQREHDVVLAYHIIPAISEEFLQQLKAKKRPS